MSCGEQPQEIFSTYLESAEQLSVSSVVVAH